MSDSKKKRMSMLDSLANAGAPAPQPSMRQNRPLRAARAAVDSHKVWDIHPDDIIDDRPPDRLDPSDIGDLTASIEATGQTVPILLRRHPADKDKYLLVYGRRRLEAIKRSDQVETVRALIAEMDDTKAVEAQISENTARRDLTYIEKALFAYELVETGFGSQSRVAEVLTATKSSVSMAMGIVDVVGPDLIRAIGPAEGIGRPRWEALAKRMEAYNDIDSFREELAIQAERTRMRQSMYVNAIVTGEQPPDPSVVAFEAVFDRLEPPAPVKKPRRKKESVTRSRCLRGPVRGTLRFSGQGVRLDLRNSEFAAWFANQADDVLADLHDQWERQNDNNKEQ